MSKFHVVDTRATEVMSIDHLLKRWERTLNRTCPITGSPVAFEQVIAGQYCLPRINGDSANGYEVYPTEEYLTYLADIVSAYLADR